MKTQTIAFGKLQPLQEFKYIGSSKIRGIKLPNGHAKFTHDANGDEIDHSQPHMQCYLDAPVADYLPVEFEPMFEFSARVTEYLGYGYEAHQLSTYRGDAVLLMVKSRAGDIQVEAIRNDGAAFGLAVSDEIYNEFRSQYEEEKTSIRFTVGEVRVLRECLTNFDWSADEGNRAWAQRYLRLLVNKVTNALPDDEIEAIAAKLGCTGCGADLTQSGHAR